jgi:homocysteine S-methyltransferase
MNLRDAFGRGETVLAEGSVYELLRRDPRVAFDPDVAHAGLVYDDGARELLAAIHREYAGIARDAGLRPLIFADSWRASAERIARSRFRGLDVNGDNARFVLAVAAASGTKPFVAAYTGPRGDAYRPSEAPSRDEAIRLHAPQVEALDVCGLDLIVAATLPSLEEARGIAALLSNGRTPWMLSFVVRPDGTLLDGTPLADAIACIDDEAGSPPIGYSINCVHPDVFRAAMKSAPGASSRIVALQANASALSPEELDGSESVEGDAPDRWAEAMVEAREGSALRIVGGCCGTSPEHLRALARRIT